MHYVGGTVSENNNARQVLNENANLREKSEVCISLWTMAKIQVEPVQTERAGDCSRVRKNEALRDL